MLVLPEEAVQTLQADAHSLVLEDGTKISYGQMLLVPSEEPVPNSRDIPSRINLQHSGVGEEAFDEVRKHLVQPYRTSAERLQLQEYVKELHAAHEVREGLRQ